MREEDGFGLVVRERETENKPPEMAPDGGG